MMARRLRARLIAGGLWVGLGKFTTLGAGLLATFLLTQLITQESFGAYGLAFSVVQAGSLLGQFGVHVSAVRFVAQAVGCGRPGLARGTVQVAYAVSLAGNAGIALLVIAAGPRLAEMWNAPELNSAIGAIALWTVLGGLQLLTAEVFRGLQDLKRATLYGGVVSWLATFVTLTGLWLATDRLSIFAAIAIQLASTAVSVAAGLLAMRRRLRMLGPADRPPVRQVLRVSLPLWISTISAMLLSQVDLWIVGSHLPNDDVAVYFLAMRLVLLVSMSLLLVNLVIPPFITQLYFTGEHQRLQRVLRQTATLAGLPALVVLGVFMAWGEQLLGLAGDTYRSGALVLALLSAGRLALVLVGSSGLALTMTGHETTHMALMAVTAVLTILGELWVVREWGAPGVAAVSAAGTITLSLATWIAARLHTGLWTHVGWLRVRDLRALLGPPHA